MKKSFLIDEDFIGSRLDRWIKKKVCNIPQSLIEKNIRKGKIKVNNKRKKSSYNIQRNDKVDFYNFDFSANVTKNKTFVYKPSKREISFSSNLFVENNENFAVINKPAGIPVQSGTKAKRNIIDIIKATKEFDNCIPFSVHRIDKETTGVLIVAKNRKYAQLFTSLFRLRKIHKVYIGLVIGEIEEKKGKLEDILLHYEGKKKIRSKALTYYEVIDSKNNYSLLKLTPETGRKHQIRKQLLLRGHPIYGDSKYNLINEKLNKKNNLMLHAYKIFFKINSNKYSFSADLPSNFKEAIKGKNLKISL